MRKMKWVLVGVLFATAMTMAGCGENGPHVQQASNGEVSGGTVSGGTESGGTESGGTESGGTGEQQTFLSPISTGYSNTAGLVFDIPQNLADSVKLTVHVPTDTVTSVTFIATPQDGANPATVSPATATVKDGVATTILTGSGVYNVTATANSSIMAKTVASGGTTLSASILVSTLTPVWQQALAPQAGYTSIATSQVANANGVYVVATNTAMSGDSVSQLSIFSTTGTLQKTINIGAGATTSSSAMSTDGTNIYVASPNSVAKYDQNGNLLWTVPWTNGPNYGVARYAAGVLYIGGGYGMPGGYVAALNAATGNQLWNTPIADGAPTDLSVAGDVYVITSANNAKRLNVSTGAVVWTATAGTAGVGWAVSATSEGVYVSGGWRGGNYYKKLSLANGSVVLDKSGVAVNQIWADVTGIYTFGGGGLQVSDYNLNVLSTYNTGLSSPSSLALYGRKVSFSTNQNGGSAAAIGIVSY